MSTAVVWLCVANGDKQIYCCVRLWLMFVCDYVVIRSHVIACLFSLFPLSASPCSRPPSSSSFACLSTLVSLVNLRGLSWIFRLTWLTSGVCSVGNSYYILDGCTRDLIHASVCLGFVHYLAYFATVYCPSQNCSCVHTHSHTAHTHTHTHSHKDISKLFASF